MSHAMNISSSNPPSRVTRRECPFHLLEQPLRCAPKWTRMIRLPSRFARAGVGAARGIHRRDRHREENTRGRLEGRWRRAEESAAVMRPRRRGTQCGFEAAPRCRSQNRPARAEYTRDTSARGTPVYCGAWRERRDGGLRTFPRAARRGW